MHRHRWLIALAVASWTVTALLATGLTLSYWYQAGWYNRSSVTSITRGVLSHRHVPALSGMKVFGTRGWYAGPFGEVGGLSWTGSRITLPPATRVRLCPWLVVPVAAAVFVTHRAIVACGRARTGSCRACGYNLAGLAPDAACPECGAGRARSPAAGG